MDFLKTFWGPAFSFKKGDVAAFIVRLIIFVVISIVAGFVLGLFTWIPIIGWLVGLVSSLMGLYCLVGIILTILVFLGIL